MSIREVLLVHHSHTDFGYTHPSQVTRILHRRYIDQALELINDGREEQEDDLTRWTCESSSVVQDWLEHAPASRVDRFIKACVHGRLEVAAMWCNLTPLFNTDQLYQLMQPIRRCRELGIPVRSAMNSDINGLPWGLVDLLLDSGIDGLTMAVNGHMGRAPLERPNAFKWVGPRGRTILTWNGYLYNDGWFYGIPWDIHQATHKLSQLIERLENKGYPHDCLMFQCTYPDFSDNGTPDPRLPEFVRGWNARNTGVRCRTATLSQFLDCLRADVDTLPQYHGEWGDFWAFGVASCAHETMVNRRNHDRTIRAGVLQSVVPNDSMRLDEQASIIQQCQYYMSMYDEHTFSADISVSEPDSLRTHSEWMEKAHDAHIAQSLSQFAERDGLIHLMESVNHGGAPGALLFNPAPYPAQVIAQLPQHWLDPPWPITLAHLHSPRGYGQRARAKPIFRTGPIELPAWGYQWVPAEAWSESFDATKSLHATNTRMESDELIVELNPVQGGIRALHDKATGKQLVKSKSLPFGGHVLETINGGEGRDAFFQHQWGAPNIDSSKQWRPDWSPTRDASCSVIDTKVIRQPDKVTVTQICNAPGLNALAYHYTLYPNKPGLHIEMIMDDPGNRNPHAHYVPFPLNLNQATCRFESMGTVIEADAEHLPTSCRDFLSVQRWIDVSDDQAGLTIVTPDIPIWMYGGFHFGKGLESLANLPTSLIAWPMNNYWDTNFRASQPGQLRFAISLHPHGPFNANKAVATAQKIVHQPLILPTTGQRSGRHPKQGRLIQFESDTVTVLSLAPTGNRMIQLRLQNISDAPTHARLVSSLLPIHSVKLTDPMGLNAKSIKQDGTTWLLPLQGRQVATFLIKSGTSSA